MDLAELRVLVDAGRLLVGAASMKDLKVKKPEALGKYIDIIIEKVLREIHERGTV